MREMVAHNPRLDQDLIAVIKKFRDDEQVKCLLEDYLPRVTYLHVTAQSHLDTGLAHGAESAPLYGLLTAVIHFGCRNAIRVSERI